MTVPPTYRAVMVVCAHPDDESFGLGAIITAFVDAGTRVDLDCLTRGEHSTLGTADGLAVRRTRELTDAAGVLGIRHLRVHDHPDGALRTVPLPSLVAELLTTATGDLDAILTFDDGGITGHPDHQHATDVAVAIGRDLGVPVLAWALTEPVAAALRAEFGAPFVGRLAAELDVALTVDRTRQRAAIACHASQLGSNLVPLRRLELQAAQEHLRMLYRPTPRRSST